MAKKGNAKGGSARKQAPQGPNLKFFYGLLGLVAVVGIGWIGMSVVNQGSGTAAIAPIQLTGLEDTDSLIAQAKGVTAGSPDAPVQILIFSDFTCPACRGFSGIAEPQLRVDYIDTDKARFTYYDFPLGGDAHRYGFIAARAARCADDQSMFWQYHDVLFGRQDEWAYSADVPLDRFVDYAEMLRMDKGAFESCLRSDEHADVVTANRILGERLGVGSTPTIFIGGRSVPNWQDYDGMKAMIDAELGAAGSQ